MKWNKKIETHPKISLQVSYKVNPILGEIKDFALNVLKDSIFGKFLPVVISDKIFDYWSDDAEKSGHDYNNVQTEIKKIYPLLAIAIPSLSVHINDFLVNINNVKSNDDIKIAKKIEHDYWINNTLLAPFNFIIIILKWYFSCWVRTTFFLNYVSFFTI